MKKATSRQNLLDIRVSNYAMINWKVITKAVVEKKWCCGCWYDTRIYCWQTEQWQFISDYEIMFHPKSNFLDKIALYIKMKHIKWEIRVIYTNKLAEKLKVGCLKAPFKLKYLLEKINNPDLMDLCE